MILTKSMLEEKGACVDGLKWFDDNFPSGGDYQDVLNKCADDDKTDYANWAISTFGGTDDVIEISEITGNHFFFAGSIRVSGSVNLSGHIRVGGSIEAGGSIKSGGSIEAGESIESGRSIEAGGSIKSGGSIEAGGSIESGRSIESGESIEAGGSIEAGRVIKALWSIESGESIKSGGGFGIFAGINIKIKDWILYAQVIAKSKPDNLISGHFINLKERANDERTH